MILILLFIVPMALSIYMTPVVLTAARALGLVVAPRPDRWHSRPVALLGGLAIFIAFTAGTLLLVDVDPQIAALLFCSTLVLVLGLIDDIVSLSPATKLLGQILAACALVALGVRIEFIAHPLLAIPLTVLWVVGITNAFNLLDNMDGLAPGVAAICAFIASAIGFGLGGSRLSSVLLVLSGALAGFLLFNFPPARIFMGDAGSMFVGFLLSAAGIAGRWEQASHLLLVIAIPTLVLAVPILDTSLVTISRMFRGRPLSQGGKDHTSHRLVGLGLSERQTVLLLYLLCATCGGLAAVSVALDLFGVVLIILAATILLLTLGLILGALPIYSSLPVASGTVGTASVPQSPASAPGVVAAEPGAQPSCIATAASPSPFYWSAARSHKMRVLEVFGDFVLACIAYAGAYAIRYEAGLSPTLLTQMSLSLPIVVGLQLAALGYFRIYRGVWQYFALPDFARAAKATAAGTAAAVVLLVGIARFAGFSRTLFLIDAILFLGLLCGSRILVRWSAESLRSDGGVRGKRVLIVGGRDLAEQAFRALRSDRLVHRTPVAFLDDDPGMIGRTLHGLEVLGPSHTLTAVTSRLEVEEVLLAVPDPDHAAIRRVKDDCDRSGIAWTEFTAQFTPCAPANMEGKA